MKVFLDTNVWLSAAIFPGLGKRRMVLNARRIVTALGNTELILLAMVNIAIAE